MSALLLAALIPALGSAPARAAALSKTDLEVVAYVLKTDVPDLNPTLTSHFLSLDLSGLPEKKKLPAMAKKVAIEETLKVHEGKKKGTIRTVPAGAASCQPERHPPEYIRVLMFPPPSFEEVEEEHVDCVERKTGCTEDDLICEFSVKVIVVPKTKARPAHKRFFFHMLSPIMAKVAECRGKGGSTNFFGSMVVACNKLSQ